MGRQIHEASDLGLSPRRGATPEE